MVVGSAAGDVLWGTFDARALHRIPPEIPSSRPGWERLPRDLSWSRPLTPGPFVCHNPTQHQPQCTLRYRVCQWHIAARVCVMITDVRVFVGSCGGAVSRNMDCGRLDAACSTAAMKPVGEGDVAIGRQSEIELSHSTWGVPAAADLARTQRCSAESAH